MRIKNCLLLGLLALCGNVAAQSSNPVSSDGPQIKYVNQFLTGPVIGEDPLNSSFHFSTFHGVAYKRFALAPGISYDTYDSWKVLHYAATAYFELTRGSSGSALVSLTAGTDAGVKNPEQQTTGWNYGNKNASMYQASVGYRFDFGKGSLYVMGGYRLQHLSYDQTPRWWFGAEGITAPHKTHIDQDMRRVVLQVGFGIR